MFTFHLENATVFTPQNSIAMCDANVIGFEIHPTQMDQSRTKRN